MINLYRREEDGKKTRRAGFVPAELYGPGTQNKNVYLSVKDAQELAFLRNRTNLNEVGIDDTVVKILVKDVARHPVTDEILHIDLYEAKENHFTNVKVPVILTGIPKGVKIGGVLNQARTSINVTAPATQIPSSIEVDVSDMVIGDALRAAELKLPENVKIKGRLFFTIASVVGRAKTEETAETAEEESSES
ncbi:MAG: 50S ribosomal protein L25 [Epsilonproteobacteria bacterium]|nr:50S ribosomal protein L25 [Campylobacterota bacterium]